MNIKVFGECGVFDEDGEKEITDPATLTRFDDYTYRVDEYDDCFGFHLIAQNDYPLIKDAGISGGYLHFDFDASRRCLVASVEYSLTTMLTDQQIAQLVRYTVGQCSDGIGSNFAQLESPNIAEGVAVSPMLHSNLVRYKIVP